MKILQVCPYFLPHVGGVERYVYNLSKNLTDKGHEINILTSNIPKNEGVEVIDGITIKRLDCIGEPLRNPLLLSISLHKNYFNNYDIINIHNIYAFSTFACLLTNQYLINPIILTHHGRLIFGEYYRDLFVKGYEKIFFRSLLNNTDFAVTLSESDAKFLSIYGKKRDEISIIPNGIEISNFTQYENIEIFNFLKKYHLIDKKIILFVGDVSKRKGIFYLIEAFNSLQKNPISKNVILLIVGIGEDLVEAKKLVNQLNLNSRIIFTGKLKFKELIQAYKSSTMYVLPSLSEGLPTTILEALFFDLPIVATDIPGIKDHFSSYALLVPPRNEKELCNSIIKILEGDYSLSRGKNLIFKKYNWEKISSEYENLYTQLLSKFENYS